MRRWIILALLFAAALWAQTPPDDPTAPLGSPCESGAGPAASLLVPYFEVSGTSNSGMDTLVGVVNLDDDPVVAHVVVWNVDAWSVFAFNIYLTGFDVATFSMRQILLYGNMPNNGCATSASRFTTRYIDCNGDGQYFDDDWTANDGMFSSPFGNYDIACYDTIPAGTLADWRCKLSTGSYDGWSEDYKGYLTIDAAVTCAYGLPDYLPVPYFKTDYLDTNRDGTPDHGILENSNVLLGDIIYYDHDAMQSDGVAAVHIEAWGEKNALPGHTWGKRPTEWAYDGVNTFYYKYETMAGLAPNDEREPLPVVWAFRYIGNQAFDGGTWVDVWRSGNPSFEHWFVPFWGEYSDMVCPWFDRGLGFTTLYNPLDGAIGIPSPSILSWDEESHPWYDPGPPGSNWPEFNNLYLAAQRRKVSLGENWPLAAESGWIQLDFRTDQEFFGPGFGHAFDQAWVNVRYSALNKYTVSAPAFAVTGGCALEVEPGTALLHPVPTH